MKSGMLAAERSTAAIGAGRAGDELADYQPAVNASWIAKELKLVQNAEPAVAKFGGDYGTIIGGIDMWMRTLKIGLPIAMKDHPDNGAIARKDMYQPFA